ncbi:MAG: hypothetical protein M0035_05340 [Actinomycetota bacterium]|jgi:hypothetical protein|nr:hypothetical protein [Actinomycetota bacterium]
MPDEATGQKHTPAATDAATRRAAPASAPFRPVSFVDALKNAFPRQKVAKERAARRPRPQAQPATGTAEDAQRVNFIDKRERLIGGFLAIFQIILGVVTYFSIRHYVEHAHKGVSLGQARLNTITTQHSAPWLLVINVVLGLGIAGAVWSKRRALVGFMIIIGGFAMNTSGGGYIGILYLVIGMWLIFRAMKKNPRRAAAVAAANAGAAGRTSGQARATAKKASEPRKPPAASKRYTPPRTTKRPNSRSPLNKVPEPEAGLRGWVSRKLGRDSAS